MKKILFLSFSMALLMSVLSSNGQTAKKETSLSKAGVIEAYYFHNNIRCVTCRTVESEAKADLTETIW
ncbi:MAG: hypothetical protein U5K79_03675 [Cyclobacteriaceae bacterium]|nr:hypothetical protein [Cyclobacteriaceae bacterium]